MSEVNAYAPPQSPRDAAPASPIDDEEAKRIRAEHLRREGAIKAVGLFTLVFGVFLLIGVIAASVLLLTLEERTRSPTVIGMLLGAVLGSFLHLYAGSRLFRLRPAGRIAYTCLAALGLTRLIATFAMQGIDLGGFIAIAMFAFFLIVIWSGRAATVFSQRYRHEVISATLTYRPSLPWWFWLITVLAIVGLIRIGMESMG